MVAITASSSGTATCRYIATVKALTKMKDQEDMKRGVHITGTITMEATHHHSKCIHLVTTLVNEKIMGFDCPILDISDSKMGKVGLAILVDMKTKMGTPTEGNRNIKLVRKKKEMLGAAINLCLADCKQRIEDN
jgi:galactokinase